MRKAVLRMFFGFIVLSPLFSAQASLVRPMNIEELVSNASRIFLGKVISVRPSKSTSKDIPAIEIEFEVIERYKGALGKTVVIRQWAAFRKSGARVMEGMPEFKMGQTAVVFLPQESSIGLTAPIGFRQGVFQLITRKGAGNLDASPVQNGLLNSALFQQVQRQETRQVLRNLKITEDHLQRLGNPRLNLGGLKELIHAQNQ